MATLDTDFAQIWTVANCRNIYHGKRRVSAENEHILNGIKWLFLQLRWNRFLQLVLCGQHSSCVWLLSKMVILAQLQPFSEMAEFLAKFLSRNSRRWGMLGNTFVAMLESEFWKRGVKFVKWPFYWPICPERLLCCYFDSTFSAGLPADAFKTAENHGLKQ